MLDPAAPEHDLVARTIVAHRAYLAALHEWECLVDAASNSSDPELTVACTNAEAHKESCRTAFRDLVDELGYLPKSERQTS